MKKSLIRNYCLMILSWCLFLNEYERAAFVLGLLGCGLLLVRKIKMNQWRLMAVCIASYSVVLSCMYAGSIPYFFPGLRVFMTVICLNAGLVNEYLYLFKVRYILPFFHVTSAAFAVLSSLIVVLPDAPYSIFGKGNLHLMSFFIFLPYWLPLACCIASKYYLQYRNHVSMERKRAMR